MATKPLDLRQVQIAASKNQLENLYFIWGEETYLVDETLKALLDCFIQRGGATDFNLDKVYATEVSGAKVRDLVETLPMMSPQRMVVVRSVNSWKDADWAALEPVINQPSSDCIFILQSDKVDKRKKSYKALASSATMVELKKPYDNQIPQWVTYIAQQNQMTLTAQQVSFLQMTVGTQLADLRNEIIKIKQFVGDAHVISDDELRSIVSESKVQTVFEFTDAVGSGRKAMALKYLSQLLDQGQSEVSILALLTRHFRILNQVVVLLSRRSSQEDMARVLGVHKFFVNQYVQQARQWSRPQLLGFMTLLQETDVKLKSSPVPPKLWLESLLFSEQLGQSTSSK